MTIYVTMTDKFMSGWGGATSRKAKYVVECDDARQADQIERIAKTKRSEMTYVNITNKKPSYPARTHQITTKKFSELGGVWLEGWT
jgi:hypothetical protein